MSRVLLKTRQQRRQSSFFFRSLCTSSVYIFHFIRLCSTYRSFPFIFFIVEAKRVYPTLLLLLLLLHPPKCMSSPAKGILGNPDLSISADNMSHVYAVQRIATFIVFSINQGGPGRGPEKLIGGWWASGAGFKFRCVLLRSLASSRAALIVSIHHS